MADPSAAAQRAAELREQLNYHIYRYHVLDAPVITDGEYDRLYSELKRIEEEHPDLLTRDSPTQRVGGPPRSDLPKVRHAWPVLSLSNVFNVEDLRAWRERIGRLLPSDYAPDYTLEPKLDGLSVVLTYEDGLLVLGATRGDGEIGEDVTPNLRTIKNLPLRIPTDPNGPPAPPRLVVRGEVFYRVPAFEALNARRAEVGEPTFVNPRNAASGALRQLDPRITADRPLEMACYAIMGGQGELPTTQWETLNTLAALGFPVMLSLSSYIPNFDALLEAIEPWETRRKTLDFEIDGLVIKINDHRVAAELGVVGKDPRGATAFKFPAEKRTTKLLDVGVNVGRTGMLVPYAILEPVEVSGVTVKQATLHNFDDVAMKDIRIGDTVIVKRSGEVIPYVVGPVPGLRTGSEWPITPPERCPFCDTPVIRAEGEVAYYCPNRACPEQLVRQIEYFVSGWTMDIVGLGERIVRQLVTEGLIKDVADVYFLQQEDLIKLEKFGEKKADNLLKAIDRSRQRPLERVIAALGIRGVGLTVAQLLTGTYRSIDALMAATSEELGQIEGLGPVLTEEITAFFADDLNRALIDKLKAGGVRMEAEARQTVSEKLAGLSFVLTGTLPKLSREQASQIIEAHGGKVLGAVSSKTSYVVAGEAAGSKLEKARKLNIPLLDEAGLLALVGEDIVTQQKLWE